LSNALQKSPGDRGGVAVDENDFLTVVYYQVSAQNVGIVKYWQVW